MIFHRITATLIGGTSVPGTSYIIKGVGSRRGEAALVYLIPNRSAPGRPREKGVTEAEFNQAYGELLNSGSFSRMWFSAHLQNCAKEGPCNFLFIGGVFVELGVARHSRGIFSLKRAERRPRSSEVDRPPQARNRIEAP